jgi:hypothetical protein
MYPYFQASTEVQGSPVITPILAVWQEWHYIVGGEFVYSSAVISNKTNFYLQHLYFNVFIFNYIQ